MGSNRLRMKLLMEAPSREFSKAIRGGVRKNESEQMQGQLAERLAAFTQAVDGIGTLRSGDTIDLDWLPGIGLQLRLNQRPVGSVTPGEDFYRSVLKIFILSVLLAGIYISSGSLIIGMVLHFLIDLVGGVLAVEMRKRTA